MTTEQPIKNLHIFLGYCEEEQYSGLHVCRHDDTGFKTPEEILRRFFLDCRDVALDYERNNTEGVNQSCLNPDCTHKNQRVHTRFCGHCGVEAEDSPMFFSRDALNHFIANLGGSSDMVGGEIWQGLHDLGWDLGGDTPGDVLVVRCLDNFIEGDTYHNCLMSRYNIPEFSDVEPPTSEWVNGVLTEPVESP